MIRHPKRLFRFRRKAAIPAHFWVAITLALAPISQAWAKNEPINYSLSGDMGAQFLTFSDNPAHPDQSNSNPQPSFHLSPRVSMPLPWKLDDGRARITAKPFIRYDSVDPQRSKLDIRELYLFVDQGEWGMRLGVLQEHWGILEGRRLIDVINQIDLVEDPRGKEKLGQPGIHSNILLPDGQLDFYLLLGHRNRTFPGRKGRFRGSSPVVGEATFTSGASARTPSYAVRYGTTQDILDVGVSLFYGLDREPNLILSSSTNTYTPEYRKVGQMGIDIQATLDHIVLKLEALERRGLKKNDNVSAVSTGMEYTFVRSIGAWDIGVLGEYYWQDQGVDAPSSTFDDDFLVGSRITFNDAGDSKLLLGVMIDHRRKDGALSMEYETWLNDGWTLKLSGSMFKTKYDNILSGLKNDDYIKTEFICNF
ncbi:MAG: hypothetical protein COB46_04365 [Rhodospirillaceae bacterium]|nr:MAG: hypothetical protein COB46_04365 [Rhodospirillaceae bacterium]